MYLQGKENNKKKEETKMMDDFMMEVTCEEVYTENGYKGYEVPTESEPF